MRILMVSPHPVYTPRGTPISVLNRCRALCELGHEVRLVTYPIGEDIVVPGLTYDRARVPGINDVRVGPSAAKLPLDAAVLLKSLRRAIAGRRSYDVLHTHEEAGVLALATSRALRIPHVYDMGNDLSVAAANYHLPAPVVSAAGALERAIVRRSDVVIAHFPSVAATAAAFSPSTPVHVVYNVPFEPPADPALAASFRARWSPDGLPLIAYTGTLEPYQGLPMLLDAIGILRSSGFAVRLAVVGGRDGQARRLAECAGPVRDLVHFEGAIPQDQVPSALVAADLLVSPRADGTNTPLKIFSYLNSGRPVIATRIPSHAQVLDTDSAVLVEPTAAGIARGVRKCLADPAWASRIAGNGLARARTEFSRQAFVEAVERAYADLHRGPEVHRRRTAPDPVPAAGPRGYSRAGGRR